MTPSRSLPLVLLVLAPGIALADSSRITSGLNQVISWLVPIGVLIAVIGLIIAGVKMTMGKQDAKEQGLNVLFGAVVILSASVIIGLLGAWFG